MKQEWMVDMRDCHIFNSNNNTLREEYEKAGKSDENVGSRIAMLHLHHLQLRESCYLLRLLTIGALYSAFCWYHFVLIRLTDVIPNGIL